MSIKIFKFSSIFSYLLYAYLFLWQIYFLSQQGLYSKELKDAYHALSLFFPSIVLFFFGLLVLADIVLKRRIILIFDCTYAASLLLMYDTYAALSMAILIIIFGLTMAALEFQKNNKN